MLDQLRTLLIQIRARQHEQENRASEFYKKWEDSTARAMTHREDGDSLQDLIRKFEQED